MNLSLRLMIATASLLLSASANADWSTATRVEQINIGGNSQHGTFIRLIDFSFTGCSNTSAAFLDGSNPNYKEMLASILAAKVTDRYIKLAYAGCAAGYSVIKEVLVP